MRDRSRLFYSVMGDSRPNATSSLESFKDWALEGCTNSFSFVLSYCGWMKGILMYLVKNLCLFLLNLKK